MAAVTPDRTTSQADIQYSSLRFQATLLMPLSDPTGFFWLFMDS